MFTYKKKSLIQNINFGGRVRLPLNETLVQDQLWLFAATQSWQGLLRKIIPNILLYDYQHLLSMLLSPMRNETYIYMCVSAQFIQEFAT